MRKNNGLLVLVLLVTVSILLFYYPTFQAVIDPSGKSGFAVYSGKNLHPQFDSWLNNRDVRPTLANTVKIGEYTVDFSVEHSRHYGYICDKLPSKFKNEEVLYVDDDGCTHWQFEKRTLVKPLCCYKGSKVDPVKHHWSYPSCVARGARSSRWSDCGQYTYNFVADYGGVNTKHDYGRGCWYSVTAKKNGEVIYQTKTNSKDLYIKGSEYIIVEDLVLELSSGTARHESFNGCSWIKSFVTYRPIKTLDYPTNLTIDSDKLIYTIHNPQSISLIGNIEGSVNSKVDLKPGDNTFEFPYTSDEAKLNTELLIPRNKISGVNLANKCANYDHGEIPYAKCNEDYLIGTLTDTITPPIVVVTTTSSTTTTTLGPGSANQDSSNTEEPVNETSIEESVIEDIVVPLEEVPSPSFIIKLRDLFKTLIDSIMDVF